MVNFKKLLTTALLSCSLTYNAIGQQPKLKPYVFFEIGYTHQFEGNVGNLYDIPLFIRNVPMHPDDHYNPHNMDPIPDSKLSFGNRHATTKLSPGIGFRDDCIDMKVSGNFIIKDVAKDWADGARKERNYANYPGTETRGYGAALTYYWLRTQPERFGYGLTARLSRLIEVNKKELYEHGLFFEYDMDLSKYGIYIENGWDRYDWYQAKDDYKMLDITQQLIRLGYYLDYDSWNFEGFLGYAIPRATPENSAKWETKNHFLIGGTIKFRRSSL